jgi:hypothetical protein
MVATVVATSGMLEAAGLPICSAISGIVRNIAAAQSEAKRLRDNAARVFAIRDPQAVGHAHGQSRTGAASSTQATC